VLGFQDQAIFAFHSLNYGTKKCWNDGNYWLTNKTITL